MNYRQLPGRPPEPIRTDATLRREVEMATLRNTNARLRGVIVDFLKAPYLSQEAVSLSISAACYVAEHPKVRQSGQCACGRRS